MHGNNAQPGDRVDSENCESNHSQFESTSSQKWIETAFQQHRDSLLRYCCHMTNRANAEEVVQETFARLCKKQESIETTHLKKWLFKVCRNQAIDITKRNGRMATSSLVETEIETTAPTPEQQVVASESANEIMQRVAELPPRQQEVIRLRFQGELSYSEIAEVIDSNVSNVGAMLHEAINKLRSRVGEEG